jgi:hypothetical protein
VPDGKSPVPLALAFAGGVFLVALSIPQILGGLNLIGQEGTLDSLAGVAFARPLAPAELAAAIARWGAAAPEIDDSDTWTGYGDLLYAAAAAAGGDKARRAQLLAAATAAYRNALAEGPANARAWTMLAAARAEVDATPEQIYPILKMSLHTGPREEGLIFTRLDLAFYLWRILGPALQAAIQDQVLIAAVDDPRTLAVMTHRHYMLGPVRDMLGADPKVGRRFDAVYSRLFP